MVSAQPKAYDQSSDGPAWNMERWLNDGGYSDDTVVDLILAAREKGSNETKAKAEPAATGTLPILPLSAGPHMDESDAGFAAFALKALEWDNMPTPKQRKIVGMRNEQNNRSLFPFELRKGRQDIGPSSDRSQMSSSSQTPALNFRHDQSIEPDRSLPHAAAEGQKRTRSSPELGRKHIAFAEPNTGPSCKDMSSSTRLNARPCHVHALAPESSPVNAVREWQETLPRTADDHQQPKTPSPRRQQLRRLITYKSPTCSKVGPAFESLDSGFMSSSSSMNDPLSPSYRRTITRSGRNTINLPATPPSIRPEDLSLDFSPFLLTPMLARHPGFAPTSKQLTPQGKDIVPYLAASPSIPSVATAPEHPTPSSTDRMALRTRRRDISIEPRPSPFDFSGMTAFEDSTPSSSVPPSLMGASDLAHPSPSVSTVADPEEEIPSPKDHRAVRTECKERLFLEAKKWSYSPDNKTLKRLLCFDDDDDERAHRIPPPDILIWDQRRYEKHVRAQHERHTLPIRVYGTPALYELDRLKCWVNLNMHRDDHKNPWPPGYICISSELDQEDILDDASSVLSSSTA